MSDLRDPDVLLAEVRRVFEVVAKRSRRSDPIRGLNHDGPDREIFEVLGAVLDIFDRTDQLDAEIPAPAVEPTEDGFLVRIPAALIEAGDARTFARVILRAANTASDENYAAEGRRASPRPPVICALCGFKGFIIFQPDDGRPATQGDDVASSIFRATRGPRQGQWCVQGHYGSSKFDCDLYRYVRNFPTAAAAPICDGCVQKIIDSGDVEQVEGNFP